MGTRWSLCSTVVDEWRYDKSLETNSAGVIDETARTANDFCVGGVNSAFTMEMTVPPSFGQSNYD